MPITLHHTLRMLAPFALSLAFAAVLACSAAAQPETTRDPGRDVQSDQRSRSDQGTQTDQGTQIQPAASESVINLTISGRATTLTRDDLRVTQGETVRLLLESDEEGEVHLHGYNLTADVSPGHPGELVFQADTAGAFALNFHVFGTEDNEPASDHHGVATPKTVSSETPVSVRITAESDGRAGVNVNIVTEGFRFAPDLVDQAHTPGAGHAHIYADGVKLGRVFDTQYHIDELAPGEREIRVSLNTNDHGELTYKGHKVEATAMVTVPDVGQNVASEPPAEGSSDGHGHSHDSPAGREIVAEVRLGNLEVYP